MKKIISIIGILAIIGIGITLSSSSSGRSELVDKAKAEVVDDVNLGVSMLAPTVTQLKVIADPDTSHQELYWARVKVYSMYDYNSANQGISSGWFYPDLDCKDVTYFNLPVLCEYQYATFCKIEYKFEADDPVQYRYNYMNWYVCTRDGGIGSAVYQFRCHLNVCDPLPPAPAPK